MSTKKLMSTYDIIKYASEEGKRISKIKDKKEKEKAYQNALNEIAIKPQTYTYPKKQEYEPISEPIQDPYNPYNRDLETYQSPRDYIPTLNTTSDKQVNNVGDALSHLGQKAIYGLAGGVSNIIGGIAKTLGNPGTAIDAVLDIPESFHNAFLKNTYKVMDKENPGYYDDLSEKDKIKHDSLFNQTKTENFLDRNIDQYDDFMNWLDNNPVSNVLDSVGDGYLNSNNYFRSNYNEEDMNKILKFGGDIVQGATNMIPSITVGALTGNPSLAMGTMGVNAYGGGLHQALSEGADLENAYRYGLANALTEVATEKLVGGIPYLGKGVTDDIATGVVDKMVKNPTAKKLIERGYDVVGEGFEEYLAEVIGEFTQDIYKDDRKELSFGERLADVQDDALYSGLVGMATSGVLNAPSYISQDIQSKRNKVDTQIDNELQNMSNEQLVEIEQELDNNSSGNEVNLNDLAEVEQIPLQDEINVVEPTNEFNADEEYLKTKQLLQETQDPVKQKQIDQFLGLLEPLVSKETLLSDDFNVRSNAQRLNAENIQIIANETGWDSNHVKMLTDFSNKNGIVVKADNLQGINGMYIDGEIVINKNTTNPLLTVFTHELTHSLENRQGYQDLQQAVLNHAKTDVLGDVEYTIQEDIQDIINARYEFDGYEMSQEEAMQEFVAQYIEENIDSETFINEISNNKPLLQRIIDWLSDVIKSFTGTPQEKAYIDLKNKYIKALNGEVITDSNTRYSTNKQTVLDRMKDSEYFQKELSNTKTTETENILKEVRNQYKITTNANEAGYIDLDGKMIDFSGKQEGGASNVRYMDHSDLYLDDLDVDYKKYIDMGNIRTFPETGGFELIYKPNKEQVNALLKYLKTNTVAKNEGSFVGISSPNKIGYYDIANLEFSNNKTANEILNEVMSYFDNESMDLNQAKYSVNKDNLRKDGNGGVLDPNSNGYILTDKDNNQLYKGDLPLNVQKKLNNGNIFPSQLEGVKYTIKNKNIRKLTLLKNIPNLDTKIDNLTETLLNYDDADFKKLVLDSTKEIYLNGDISQDLKGMMVDYVVDNAKVYDDIESTLYKDEFGEHQIRQHTKENINKYINDIKTSIKYKDNIIQKSPQGQQTIGDAYTDSVKAVKDLALQDSDVYINDIKPLIDEGDYIDSKESENATEYINDVHTIALGGKNRGALNKTIEQNGDAVANGNQEVRHAWKNIFEIPLFTAKGKYSNNTIKNLDLVYSKIVNELGIKKGSKEDSAIMWYGEGERIKQDTNVKSKKIEFEPYTLNDLKRDFPKTWQNVVEAEKVMRAIYDDYVVRLNEESLSKIYSDESIKNEIATKKRKINNEIEHNRKLLQQELKKPIADRNIKYVESLNNQIKKLSYQFNNVETDVMTGKRLKPRKNYFRHYQEMSTAESIKALFDSESRANISNKLAGISEFTKPYTRWESFMQPRNKGRYKESALGGMIQYIPRAEYKIYIDPVTAYNRGVIKDIVEISDANGIDNTVMINWLSNFTNDLAGKTNPIDRVVSHIEGGRKFVQLLKKLNKYPKINAVVGNLSSAVSQFYNFPNVTALLKKQGGMKFTQDLNQGAKLFWADAYHDRELMQSSPFLTERFLDSHISQFDEGLLHKPKQLAEFIAAFGDDTIAKYGWYSAYAQALRLNVDNPIYYADALTRRAVAGRGVGEVALAQKSELTKLLGPFQVEVNNTWQLVKALATDGTKDIYRAGKTLAEGVKKGNLKETMPKVKASLGGAEKELGSLFMLFLVTFFMNEVTEPITGRRVGFDTIGDIEDAIESKNPMRVVGGVIENMPLGAPVAMLTMQDYERERLFGDSDPTRYGVGNIGLTAFTTPLSQYARGEEVDLLKPFSQFGVPYGGRQFERTYKYLQDIGMFPTATVTKRENSIFPKFEFGWADEGAYTKDGRLKYVIDTDNPFDVAQGLAFGSYATDEGKKYLEKTTPLSQTKTSIVEDFTEFGMKKSDAFELMKNLEKENIIGLDGEKLKLSMATLNRQAFEESGVFDDIVELVDKGKYEPKDFGLNKTIVYDDDKYYEILKEIEEIQSQGYEEVENSMIKDFENWLNSK